ncbi:glycosyltransferase family 2 protein [Aliiroseovarius sp. S253]|uniref:glycosyltransferase family 2 protein n=1 Tax=Aliiroseovarius sp. S253 TaxID=3415133 RepID=UPI003C7DDDA2
MKRIKRLAAQIRGVGLQASAANRTKPVAPPIIENDTRKPLAAVTFVWNEEAYLQKWVDYYAGQLGRENLFVFAHGEDPMVSRVAEGCRIYGLPRSRVDALFARRKSDLAAGAVSFLLAEYKTVIVGDVDEMVIVDPAKGGQLIDYVETHRGRNQSLKPFNFDLLDDPDAGALDMSKPIFAQRNMTRTRYQFCKPVIVSDRIEFAAGFHYSDHYPELAEDAYLVHLHFADRAINQEIDLLRQASFVDNPHLDKAHERSKGYWSKHMQRYSSRNRRSASMPILDLDDAMPQFWNAMRGNIIRQPQTQLNSAGWTMSYGNVDAEVRLRIPSRFSEVL